MQALIEFLPLIAFAVAYKLGGVYVATAVLMVAMPLMLGALWLMRRRLPTMPLVSTLLVLAFGGLTLLLHDKRFIQWKPTIFFWSVAAVLLVAGFTAREPLVRRILEPVAVGRRVSSGQWRALNWVWVLFCVAIGVANLVVARVAAEPTWVNFKVYGLTAATMLFMIAQAFWLQRLPADEHAPPAP